MGNIDGFERDESLGPGNIVEAAFKLADGLDLIDLCRRADDLDGSDVFARADAEDGDDLRRVVGADAVFS